MSFRGPPPPELEKLRLPPRGAFCRLKVLSRGREGRPQFDEYIKDGFVHRSFETVTRVPEAATPAKSTIKRIPAATNKSGHFRKRKIVQAVKGAEGEASRPVSSYCKSTEEPQENLEAFGGDGPRADGAATRGASQPRPKVEWTEEKKDKSLAGRSFSTRSGPSASCATRPATPRLKGGGGRVCRRRQSAASTTTSTACRRRRRS